MDESPLPPLQKPPLPPVQRLSRGVLVVMAGLVAVTLLAVAFFATPRTIERPVVARPVAGGTPGFLERPPAAAPTPAPSLSETEFLRRTWDALGRAAGGGAGGAGGGRGAGAGEPGRFGGDGEQGAAGNGGGAGAAVGGPGALAGGDGEAGGEAGRGARGWGAAAGAVGGGGNWRDERREAFLRALRAPLTVAGAAAASPAGGRQASPWPVLRGPEWLGFEGGGVAPARGGTADGEAFGGTGAGVGLAPDRRGAGDDGRAGRGRGASGQAEGAGPGAAKLAVGGATETGESRAATWGASAERYETGGGRGPAGEAGGGTEVADGSEVARAGAAQGSPWAAAARQGGGAASRLSGSLVWHGGGVLPAGTVIPALLLTAVNSDLPGTLIAQVSRDVYDLRQREVVLARGTRLLGRYDNQVAVGQQRLLVAWTRLQLLDGTLVDLPGLPAVTSGDPAGAAGLPATVNNHVLRVFGDAILLSLLSAGADLSQPASQGALAAPSAGSVASAAVGLQLSEAGTQVLRRDLNIQPTLSLAAGTPLTVFVNTDLPVPAAAAAPATPATPAIGGTAAPGGNQPPRRADPGGFER